MSTAASIRVKSAIGAEASAREILSVDPFQAERHASEACVWWLDSIVAFLAIITSGGN